MMPPEPTGATEPGPFRVSLENCEREPIHIPGSIQPLGGLLAFEPGTGVVLHSSRNIGEWLPVGQRPALGRSMTDIVGEAAYDHILHGLAGQAGGIVRHAVVTLPARPGQGQPLDLEALIHCHRGVGFAEVEALPGEFPHDWLQELEDANDALRCCVDLDDLVQRIPLRIKRLTGFDRVMVYRFDDYWNGRVIAEAREADLESFHDLHYPASDIPAQARELYRTNLVRYIADVGYAPVPVVPWLDRVRGQPLDLSHAALRAISPMHIQYLRNMGVGSTLTLSLLVNDRLWGLIACHHGSPTRLPLRLRRACYVLAVTLGYMVSACVQQALNEARSTVAEARRVVLDAFNQTQLSLPDVLEHSGAALLKMGGASAGAFWLYDRVFFCGLWPGQARSDSILKYARRTLQTTREDMIFMERMDPHPPLTADELRTACGLAAINLDPFATCGLLWLRPEYRREVTWGGDPDKPVQVETDASGRPLLSPRNSFARWVTEVKGLSRPWSEVDREALHSLLALRQILVVRESLNQVMLSNRQFHSLLTLQSDAYWQVDTEGRLLILSKTLVIGDGSLDGRRLPDLFAECREVQGIVELERALTERCPFRHLLVTGHAGTGHAVFEYQFNGEPIRDAEDRLIGMHGTISDMTERRQYEECLLESRRLADAANAAKSLFLAHMSHEIRTPMNAILGLTQLLQRGDLGPEDKLLARQIQESGDSLLRIINDILDFSKIEAGQLGLESRPFWPDRLLERVHHLLGPLAEAKGLALRLETFPDGAVPRIGDSLRLEQILVNLVGNAIKFSERGEITLGISPLPTGLRFEVRDHGIGIDADVLPHLFQPFSQADMSITRRYGGTGLGLVICKRLVDMMGGRIGVASQPGEGSHFWFEVPLPSASVGESAMPVDAMEPAAPQPNRCEGLRVLAVDDNRINLMVVRRALEMEGAVVSLAADGRQALELLLANPAGYDVVLMDIQMPVMDGLSATREIRRDARLAHLPVIALTAGVMPEEREAALRAGVNDLLAKPLDIQRMVAMLSGISG